MNIDYTVLHRAKMALSAIDVFSVLFGYARIVFDRVCAHALLIKAIISRL